MASSKSAVRVHGYREFLRACDRADKETKQEMRSTFREVGEVVREPWAGELSARGIPEKTQRGLRTSVKTSGVSVRQGLRKKTGKHPEFGRLQQRIGDEVADQKEPEVERAFERAIDRVVDHFDDKP